MLSHLSPQQESFEVIQISKSARGSAYMQDKAGTGLQRVKQAQAALTLKLHLV
jgi:hypothetical protein